MRTFTRVPLDNMALDWGSALLYTYLVLHITRAVRPMPQKNITLSIDEDLLDKARVLAAMRRTSVNEMVREYLQHAVDQEKQHCQATEALLKLARESDADFGPGPFVREEAYSGAQRFDRWR